MSSIKSNGSPDPEKQLHEHEHDGELEGGRDEKIDTLNVLSPSDTTAPVDPTSLWGRSLALSAKLERKVGIEARGIQRVPEGERGGGPAANFFMCVFVSLSHHASRAGKAGCASRVYHFLYRSRCSCAHFVRPHPVGSPRTASSPPSASASSVRGFSSWVHSSLYALSMLFLRFFGLAFFWGGIFGSVGGCTRRRVRAIRVFANARMGLRGVGPSCSVRMRVFSCGEERVRRPHGVRCGAVALDKGAGAGPVHLHAPLAVRVAGSDSASDSGTHRCVMCPHTRRRPSRRRGTEAARRVLALDTPAPFRFRSSPPSSLLAIRMLTKKNRTQASGTACS
jgi:hypothetical protein